MSDSIPDEELKSKILELTEEYSKRVHRSNLPGNHVLHPNFNSNDSVNVPYAGRVFTSEP